MPVTIDEVTADVERGNTPEAPAARHEPQQETSPQAERRRQCDVFAQLQRRAARLHAD